MLQKIILSLTVLLLISCGGVECTENSEKIALAKNLSKQQLELFYDTALKLMAEKNNSALEGDLIPNEFSSVQPSSVRVKSESVLLYLEACSFDDKVVIFINKEKNNKGSIILRWGEGPEITNIELWHQA